MMHTLRTILQMLTLLFLTVSLVQAQQRLDRPTNLQFSGDTLSWDAVENAGSYRLRWRAGNVQWDSANIPSSQTSYNFSALPLNVSHTVQVRARADNSGNYLNSFWSSAFTIQRTPTPTATTAPTNTLTPNRDSDFYANSDIYRDSHANGNHRAAQAAAIAAKSAARGLSRRRLGCGDGRRPLSPALVAAGRQLVIPNRRIDANLLHNYSHDSRRTVRGASARAGR